MKRNLFLWAAFAVMMALAGCTQKEIVYVEKEDGTETSQDENVIEISLSSVVSTRAARPIGSSEAANNVNRLMFKFYNHGSVYDGASISAVSSENGGTSYTDKISGGNIIKLTEGMLDGEKTLRLTLDGLPKEKSNEFTIVAYGYNVADEGTDFPLTVSGTHSDGVETYTVGHPVTEEIFAGHVVVEVNSYGKLKKGNYELELTRQVAGMLAYFSKAPTYVDNKKVKTITVETGVPVVGLRIPASLLPDSDFNGVLEGGYRVVELLTFNMAKASNYGDSDKEEVEDEFYEFENEEDDFLWAEEMTDATKPANLKCKSNTLFGSCFLAPFSGHIGGFNIGEGGNYYEATLNIVYYGIDGGVIKKIPLKVKQDDAPADSDGQSFYDIRCNNFYSIGAKTEINDGDSDEPGVPETDVPLPIDPGTGYMDFFVSINDAWNIVEFEPIK